MAILVLISVMTPKPHEKICLLTFFTGIALRSESNQVHGGYSRKNCAWAVENYVTEDLSIQMILDEVLLKEGVALVSVVLNIHSFFSLHLHHACIGIIKVHIF